MTDNPTIVTHRWSSHRPKDRFTVETRPPSPSSRAAASPRDMRIATEDIFGPAVTVIAFNTEDEAVAIANEPDYGLLAGIYTRDSERAFRALHPLRAAGRPRGRPLPAGSMLRNGRWPDEQVERPRVRSG